jgi:thiol-disulfide isomerase/thioredoxin
MKKILNLIIISLLIFVWGCKKKEQINKQSPEQTATVQTKQTKPVQTQVKKHVVKSKTNTKPVYVRGETHFVLPSRLGGTIDLETYAGKPVILMFFAQYCPFCMKAAPFVEKVYQQYKNKGLNVIGISIEDEKQLADAFANDYGLTFPITYKGVEVAQKYRTRGVPYIFILDKSHKIYNVWPGYDESFNSDIVQSIEEVLKI